MVFFPPVNSWCWISSVCPCRFSHQLPSPCSVPQEAAVCSFALLWLLVGFEGCLLPASLPSRSLQTSCIPPSKAELLSGDPPYVPLGPTYPFRPSLEVETAPLCFSSAAHNFVSTPLFNSLQISQFWVCHVSCWG